MKLSIIFVSVLLECFHCNILNSVEELEALASNHKLIVRELKIFSKEINDKLVKK